MAETTFGGQRRWYFGAFLITYITTSGKPSCSVVTAARFVAGSGEQANWVPRVMRTGEWKGYCVLVCRYLPSVTEYIRHVWVINVAAP